MHFNMIVFANFLFSQKIENVANASGIGIELVGENSNRKDSMRFTSFDFDFFSIANNI